MLRHSTLAALLLLFCTSCSPEVGAPCSGCLDADGACAPGTSVERCGGAGSACAACPPGEACSGGRCEEGCASAAECASDNPCLKPFCATATTHRCVTAYATNLETCDGDGDGAEDDHCFGWGECCDGCSGVVCDAGACAFACLPSCPPGDQCLGGSCVPLPALRGRPSGPN